MQAARRAARRALLDAVRRLALGALVSRRRRTAAAGGRFAHHQRARARVSTWTIDVRVAAEFYVVCSGDLRAHRLSADEKTKSFSYEVPTPTLASGIALAIAPFVVVADATRRASLTYFCLPADGAAARLAAAVTHVATLFDACERYLGTPMPV